MTSAARIANLANSRQRLQWWIEIEGIRRRFGTDTPSWAPADSGTNQPILSYMTEAPKIKGQEADPLNGDTKPQSFTVKILDKSNLITDLFSFNVAPIKTKVTAAITHDGTTLTVADSSVFGAAPFDIFVDKETMNCTAIPGGGVTLTVTRGMYGSIAVAHAITNKDGASITLEAFNRPQFMVGRKAILCEGVNGLVEADKMQIQGFITEASVDESVWQLDCTGALGFLKKRICTEMPAAKLLVPLWSGDVSGTEWDDLEEWQGCRGSGPQSYWAIMLDSETTQAKFQSAGVVQVGEELIRYEAKDASNDLKIQNVASVNPYEPYFSLQNRGLYSREILGDKWFRDTFIWAGQTTQVPQFCEGHEAGEDVKQVLTNEAFTGFTSPNPIQAMLILMLSARGDGDNGAYDLLPEGWGAGIPQALVDVTGMVAMADTAGLSQVAVKVCINEPVELYEWLQKNILCPCHLFLTEDLDGKITIKRLMNKDEATHDPTGASIDLDVGELTEAPKWAPGELPLGEVTVKCNWNPGQDKYYTQAKCQFGESLKRYDNITRRAEIECKTIYIPGVGPSANITTESEADTVPLLAQFIAPLFERFAINPCPSVRAVILYKDRYYCQVGNIVTLTMAGVPDAGTGSRGVTAQWYQIIAEKPDTRKGTSEIDALMIGAHDKNYRRIAPSAKVAGYDADGGVGGTPRITLDANIFSASPDHDSDSFIATDKIILVTSAYVALNAGAAPEVCTIRGVGTDYVDLTAAPVTAPADGDFIDTAPYTSGSVTQKAAWSFQAGSDEKIDTDPGVIRQ